MAITSPLIDHVRGRETHAAPALNLDARCAGVHDGHAPARDLSRGIATDVASQPFPHSLRAATESSGPARLSSRSHS